MFGFIKAISFFSCNKLQSVSMNNQECEIRPQKININSNEPLFYPCNGSCNDGSIFVFVKYVHVYANIS